MNLSGKLVLPFAIVVLFMVGGMAAYVYYWQQQEGRSAASVKIGNALSNLNSDFGKIQASNRDLANRLSRDNALVEALNKQDRASIISITKNASEARGFSGIITTFDENGKVIFSSDTPAKFGYSMRGKNNALDYVLNSQDGFIGPTFGLSAAQSIALSALVPVIASNGQCAGIVAVSEPIDEAFLTGEALKLALISEPLSNIDFVLLGVRDRDQISITPALLRDKPAFLRTLSDSGVKAIPDWQEPGSWQISNIFNWFSALFNKNANVPGGMAGFVKDNRLWQPLTLVATANKFSGHGFNGNNSNNGCETIGIIIATTPLRPEGIKPGFVVFAACIMGLAALFSVIALSAQISSQPDDTIGVLVERIKKWRTEKHLPPVKKLSGSWQELSELIDQTLIEWQSTIQGLKIQLNKVATPKEGYSDQSTNTDEQFAALNRQLATQNRQLSEFSRQLNQANQQSVFLQNELDAVLQSTTEGFLILDQYGNLIHANPIFLNWLAMSEAEIAGRFCFDIVKKPQDSGVSAPDKTETPRPFIKHESEPGALINQFFPEGIVQNAQSGKLVEVILHLQPVTTHDNKVSGYILVARDKSLRSEIAGLKMEIITMLARAIRGPLLSAEKEWQNILATQDQSKEQSLRLDKNAEPDQSFPEEIHEQLNRELNQELKQAELTGQQKLSNLHARYENLIKSVENLLAAHGQAIGQMIPLTSESGSFSATDLNSVLVTVEPTKESFPVSRLVGECLKEAANLASEKQLMLDYKTSTALPGITGDRALMKSILAPIVEKMILVTENGGSVRVESAPKDKQIQISISSSGPPLSEEETANMFAGFDPEKHSEDTYGLRLALYLSRNNAERIGAKIWAQLETHSDSGNEVAEIKQGTTVYITFPIV